MLSLTTAPPIPPGARVSEGMRPVVAPVPAMVRISLPNGVVVETSGSELAAVLSAAADDENPRVRRYLARQEGWGDGLDEDDKVPE